MLCIKISVYFIHFNSFLVTRSMWNCTAGDSLSGTLPLRHLRVMLVAFIFVFWLLDFKIPALMRFKPSTAPFTALSCFSQWVSSFCSESSLYSWLWNPKETGIYLNNDFVLLVPTVSEYLIYSKKAGEPWQGPESWSIRLPRGRSIQQPQCSATCWWCTPCFENIINDFLTIWKS